MNEAAGVCGGGRSYGVLVVNYLIKRSSPLSVNGKYACVVHGRGRSITPLPLLLWGTQYKVFSLGPAISRIAGHAHRPPRYQTPGYVPAPAERPQPSIPELEVIHPSGTAMLAEA